MRGARSAILAAALILPATAFAGGPVEINVGDSFFSPTDHQDTVSSGQTINWSWGPGDTAQAHSVHQDRNVFDSGQISGSGNLTIEPSAGTYPYYCENHGSPSGGGMSGVLRFGMPTPAVALDGTFSVTWAVGTSATGDHFDVQYRKGSGKFKDWFVNTQKRTAIFGKNAKPVTSKPGKSYTFRARSQVGTLDTRRSDWSPQLTVTVPE